MKKTVNELARLIGGEVAGDGETPVTGITNIESPLAGAIAFVQNEKLLKQLESSPLACLIVPQNIQNSAKVLIRVANPKLAWAQLIPCFYSEPELQTGISPQAFIAETAKIGKNVTIEPFAFIAAHATVGDGAVIRAGAVVGEHAVIGHHSYLHAGARVYRRCVLGERVILHAGSVIGADGFGYVATAQKQEKVPQVGNVILGNDVEIGANTTIDRATIGSTKIGNGCKIDNLVQIGHNVEIGDHTVISSQTGISGSSRIGAHVTMGGKVGVGDHVEIGDWVMVGAGAGLPTGKKIPSKQIIFGEPARPYQEARRQIAAQLRSAEMYDEIKRLRKKLAELEEKISGTAPKA